MAKSEGYKLEDLLPDANYLLARMTSAEERLSHLEDFKVEAQKRFERLERCELARRDRERQTKVAPHSSRGGTAKVRKEKCDGKPAGRVGRD